MAVEKVERPWNKLLQNWGPDGLPACWQKLLRYFGQLQFRKTQKQPNGSLPTTHTVLSECIFIGVEMKEAFFLSSSNFWIFLLECQLYADKPIFYSFLTIQPIVLKTLNPELSWQRTCSSLNLVQYFSSLARLFFEQLNRTLLSNNWVSVLVRIYYTSIWFYYIVTNSKIYWNMHLKYL